MVIADLHFNKWMLSLKRENGPLRSKPLPVATITIHAPCQPVPLLGHASRIPGVTPAAVSLVNVYIEIQAKRREQAAAI